MQAEVIGEKNADKQELDSKEKNKIMQATSCTENIAKDHRHMLQLAFTGSDKSAKKTFVKTVASKQLLSHMLWTCGLLIYQL